MKFAKCLLVALALWMPTASFAAALASAGRTEQAAPCDEQAPEESSDSRSEANEMFLPSFAIPFKTSTAHTVELLSHRPLDGHIAELHSPPPNTSSPR